MKRKYQYNKVLIIVITKCMTRMNGKRQVNLIQMIFQLLVKNLVDLLAENQASILHMQMIFISKIKIYQQACFVYLVWKHRMNNIDQAYL